MRRYSRLQMTSPSSASARHTWPAWSRLKRDRQKPPCRYTTTGCRPPADGRYRCPNWDESEPSRPRIVEAVPHLGITLPGMSVDATRDTPLAFARRAEAAGLHSIWATDRILDRTPDPLVTLGAVAAITTHVKLGTSVLLGSLRRPVPLAKSVATLDQISGGRCILGLGVGSRATDFDASEVPLAQRGGRMDDLLPVLRLAWSGQPIRHQGRYVKLDVGPMGLLPPQGDKL